MPAVEVRKLAQRGVLRRLAHGVYLHRQVPRDRFTDAAEAVATVGEDAFLDWDAVLSLYDLALVDPSVVRVGVTRRYRGSPRARAAHGGRGEELEEGPGGAAERWTSWRSMTWSWAWAIWELEVRPGAKANSTVDWRRSLTRWAFRWTGRAGCWEQ
ncbi:MAG: hypothetical protein L0G62_00325 [Micrococcaceae bacterium]|nr:hypothetical protein [Micrococcaceae bacterium]